MVLDLIECALADHPLINYRVSTLHLSGKVSWLMSHCLTALTVLAYRTQSLSHHWISFLLMHSHLT